MDDEAGVTSSRRDLIKKGAVAGGIVWMAPVVQTLAAGASSSPATCDLTVTPAPGVLCSATAGTPYRGRATAGGGQFRATHLGAGLFEVSWPLTPVCAPGCQLVEQWSWALSGATMTDCGDGTATSGLNNVTGLVGPTNGSTVQFQKTNLTANMGVTITVTVTFTCGASAPQQFSRTERLRQLGAATNPFADTFLAQGT